MKLICMKLRCTKSVPVFLDRPVNDVNRQTQAQDVALYLYNAIIVNRLPRIAKHMPDE